MDEREQGFCLCFQSSDAFFFPGRRAQVSLWALQQLDCWLESNTNSFLPLLSLKWLYDPEKKMIPTTDFSRYWAKHPDSYFIRLVCFPLEEGLKLFTLSADAGLRRIWDIKTYQRDFLICHHLFISSLDLMKALRSYYRLPQPEGIDADEVGDLRPAQTVTTILSDWILMEYGSDFLDNDELVEELESFLREDIAKEDASTAREIHQLLHTALHLPYPRPIDLNTAPKPILPRRLKFDEISFHTLSPMEVARQMTLLDQSWLHRVRAKEFLGCAWTKKDAMVRAPNLTKFIQHTNKIAGWVVTEILSQRTLEGLEAEITFWIRVGKELLDLRNYNGVMNILTSLHSATISRLRQAWGVIKKQDKEIFDQLTESLSLLGHYKNYRETLKTLAPSTPVVPLIAVTCSDLNGLGEVLENNTPEGWINWEKHSKFAEHIWSVKRFMRARYIFKAVPEIQQYIDQAQIFQGEKTMAAIAKFRNDFCENLETLREIETNQALRGKGKVSAMETEMTDHEWQALSSGSQLVKYKAGEVLVDIGVVHSHLFRLRKGTCSAHMMINGKKTQVSLLKPGTMFGEMSLLQERAGLTTVAIISDTDTEVCKYAVDFVLSACKSTPHLSEQLNKILSARLADRLKNFGRGAGSVNLGSSGQSTGNSATTSSTIPTTTTTTTITTTTTTSNTATTNIPVQTAVARPAMSKIPSMTSLLTGNDNTTLDEEDDEDTGPRGSKKLYEDDEEEDDLGGAAMNALRAPMMMLNDLWRSDQDPQIDKRPSARIDKSKRTKPEGKKGGVIRGTLSMFNDKETNEDSQIDSEFNKLFKIKSRNPEVLLKTFLCTLKSVVTAHGTLFVTKNMLCFHASTFGRKTKEVISFLSMTKIENDESRIIIEASGKIYYLKDFGSCHKEAWNLISSLHQNRKTEGGDDFAGVIVDDDEEDKKQDSLSLLPTNQDWSLIISGTRSVRYRLSEFVIQQGQQQHQCIFQIAKGKCRIEKQLDNGSTDTIAQIVNGSIFGEISFLEGDGGKASASVVADEDDTIIQIIEGFFLDIAFEYYPDLSGRFYHYLAQMLSERLKEREATANTQLKNQEEEESSYEKVNQTSRTRTRKGANSMKK
eukprot:TRINITY_DN7248_c0_g2_i1.p1 TRINITY_DN7248_c0_g2~~TRINITY_DN7248_c0_g2_i1.p1  ORF type:complete len:1107 (+),score=252.97 TRINITY_DN7248_c0_g2_i1:576-3896(+)